ncbi:hypothetical protein D3C75_829830 [compost metagenome]
MRKIVVEGNIYYWQFRGVKGDVSKSALTVISENKVIRLVIHFSTRDTYTAGNPLNEGLPMIKMDEKYLINLNQPRYVAEIVQYILEHSLMDYTVQKSYDFNGNELLLHMGYEDTNHFLN